MPECPLLFFVSCKRIFRWWWSALHLFRRRFLWRDWGMCRARFPERSGVADGSRFAPVRFGTCPALGSGTPLGRRAPFRSGAALYLRPLFPGRALGRRTFYASPVASYARKHSNKENLPAKRGPRARKLTSHYDRSAMCWPAPIPQFFKGQCVGICCRDSIPKASSVEQFAVI